MEILKEATIHDGRVGIQLVRDGRSQFYLVDGKRPVRVTDVTGMLDKPALKFWAVNCALDHIRSLMDERGIAQVDDAALDIAKKAHSTKSKEAADIGTQVHEWVENHLKTGQTILPTEERVLNGVLGFLRWREERVVDFVSSERMVYSPKHGYVGTMDAEAVIDGKLSVVDFKTSKAIYPEYRLQVAAYQAAAEEEGSRYDGNRVLARFDKETGEFEAVEIPDQKKDFAAFKGLLEAKKRLIEIEKTV